MNLTEGQELPVINSNSTHFYYSSLNYIEVMYAIDVKNIKRYLDGTGLSPVLFDGKASVLINYHNYSSQFSNAQGLTEEVEVGIICFPEKYGNYLPIINYVDFLKGEEQTKNMGIFRTHVPCDDEIAIIAGIEKFGEPKFKASFTSDIPSYNTPDTSIWNIQCNDEEGVKNIFSLKIDFNGLKKEKSNMSPVTYYGLKDSKILVSRWNILQPLNLYLLNYNSKDRVQFNFGNSNHPMKNEIKDFLTDASPIAIREYQSMPVAIQNRPYYI